MRKINIIGLIACLNLMFAQNDSLALSSPIKAEKESEWSIQIKPLYNTLLWGNDISIGSEYYFSYTEPLPGSEDKIFPYSTIQKPIILHIKPAFNFEVNALWRKKKWSIGARTWGATMSSPLYHNVITTPGRIKNDNGRTTFNNGITLWNFDFIGLTNLSQPALKSPIWWNAKNGINVWSNNLSIGYRINTTTDLTFGLKYVETNEHQNVFQKQIVYLNDLVEVVYEDNFTMRESSNIASYLTGPNLGVTFSTPHIKASLEQSLLFGNVQHDNNWTSYHDIVVTVFEQDTSYVYNAWETIGQLPFVYALNNVGIPSTDVRVELSLAPISIYKNLALRLGINTSLYAFWKMPTTAKLSLSQKSWFSGGSWDLNEKTLVFVNAGITFGLSF